MVGELKDIIAMWKEKSVVFDLSAKKPLWLDYLVSPLIRLFQSIL